MTEHKFADEEVIKALECHKDYWADNCFECPYQSMLSLPDNNCVAHLSKDALDLINRQKAEIERLDTIVNPKEHGGSFFMMINEAKEKTEAYIRQLKAEAVKEFAKSIKTYYAHIDKTVGALINYTIDQKLKEFLGEGGGKENG